MSNITHLDKLIIHRRVEEKDFASINRTTSSSREEFISMRVCVFVDLKFDRAFRNQVNKRNYEI